MLERGSSLTVARKAGGFRALGKRLRRLGPCGIYRGRRREQPTKQQTKKKIKRVASFFSHPRLHAATQKDTQHEAVITTPIHSSCAFSILAMTSCKTHA